MTVGGGLLEPSGTVKQVVVENRVLIEQTCAGANHCLTAAGRVPGKSQRRTKIVSWVADAITQTLAPKIQNVSIARGAGCGQRCGQRGIKLRARNWPYITIGASRVMHISDAVVHRKVRLHLP